MEFLRAWGNANKLSLDALFRIQKRAVRNINHAGFYPIQIIFFTKTEY